ncbi:MAG: methyltransferase domain-containing protein [Dehalococcoidia bacterium]|nr:methyltransferase domain-containing protein [Dehalococcoidia bacterium]
MPRVLLGGLTADAHLIATDLNPAMFAVGQPLVGDDPRLEWRESDAQALPFEDGSFDALVC